MSELETVRYHTGDQFVHAQRGPEGRKYIPLAYITDAGAVLRYVPREEARHMTVLDYPAPRAVKALRRTGRRLGISKAAATFIGGGK